ncbi:helix-turn-helix domain-containing protein [uncultured Flavonifractor sp.]|uniref:helix-turn-helix domain-containing protein n=1 Tax=uncultured Flavonifractor sp. TaxID=1193534 RepID=UPI00260485C7|nr:helix-turn-helix transcriptional regulator [uncultured Flavonifractor sp.]
MTLGEKICRLRKARGLSQGDLADALGVSRQSVSKWETDSSVPDLDKLVALSRRFGVTLDELVCGEGDAEKEREPEPPTVAQPQGRQVLGGVLLAVGLLGLLLFTLLWGLEGLLLSLMLLLPFLLCGVLCLRVRVRLGLWCAWAVYLPQQVYWTIATGITWHLVLATPHFTREMNYFRLFIGWVMLAVMAALTVATARSFSDLRKEPTPKMVGVTVVLWAAALLIWRLRALFFGLFADETGLIQLPGLVTGLLQGACAAGQTAALAAAITLTLALLRGRRKYTPG